VRLLIWFFRGLWNGSKGSLIGAIILLAVHLNIFEDIVDDENLEGRAIEVLFIMGESEQDTVMAYFVVDALLLGLAILGLSRYVYLRSKAA
jgi:hypothetical protein